MKQKEITKYQHGGWTGRKFKQIRLKLRRLERKELDIPQDIKFK